MAPGFGQEAVPLIDPAKPAGGWAFSNGPEFPGAKGTLALAPEPYRGKPVLALHGDFTEGGNYVQAWTPLPKTRVKAISFWVNCPPGAQRLPIRYTDETDKVHQVNLRLSDKGGWQHIVFPVEEFFRSMAAGAGLDIVAGYETWGGAQDRQKHNKPHQECPNLAILASRAMGTTKGTILINDVLFFPAAAPKLVTKQVRLDELFQEGELDWGFNLGQEFRGAKGGLDLVRDQPEAGRNAMRLHADFTGGGAYVGARRSLAQPGVQATKAIRLRMRSETAASYGVRLVDSTGQCHQQKRLPFQADGRWHEVELVPAQIAGGEHWGGANDGRWHDPAQLIELMLNVESHQGKMPDLYIADMRAEVVADANELRVERVLLATDALGNLFFPGERTVVKVTVEAVRQLGPPQPVVRYSLRDCWGAEQLPAGEVTLQRAPRKQGRFVYTAEIALPEGRLAVGKFCELHVEVPQGEGEPAREHTGLAILPPAVTRQHPPESVPFTIRNWDSRVPVYFRLADRLGLRLLGVWGGWSPKPPYEPYCPGIELCAELGAKWVTGTPAASVERKGFAEYSEEALRKGMRNFLEKYAGRGLAMIALGNEPHGTGEKVLENVRAYKAIYETVKAFDPKIHVIGTSVEPNEEYFKAGYHNYLDSYDFHIYEHYTDVRRTMREYRELMKKYGAVKPIHSTELGLNSQGQTRLAVARELVKKITVFFAEGGATVSWFTIQYPDPQGKARGQAGDAHCVFDCKYNLYNPRLDAIAYYNIINGICIKKFIQEVQHPNGVQTYLFRDKNGDCLQVVWLDGKREDFLLPIPEGTQVQLVAIDGTRTVLRSEGGGVKVTASEDPILLLYRISLQPYAR